MRIPTVRRRSLGGLAAALVLAAGGVAAAAGPASATAARGASASVVGDCDPVGTVQVSQTTVDAGQQVTVSWDAENFAACNPPVTALSMSGPGFSGDEIVPGSGGSRTVTVTRPGEAVWNLSIHTSRGETQLAQGTANVIQVTVAPGLAGGAVALANIDSVVQKAETTSIVSSTGSPFESETNPAMFNVGGDYEVAYRGLEGHLWLMAPDGTATDTGLSMMAGSSPSITATDGANFTVAFAAATSTLNGDLWTYSSATGGHDLRLPVFQGTSPSVTLTRSGIAIAFADSNDNLSAVDPLFGFGGFGSPHAPLAPGTSPAITYIPGVADGYEIVYQAPDHTVRTADSTHSGTFPTALTAHAGTSPASTTLPSGEIDFAVAGPDLVVRTQTLGGAVTDTGAGLLFGTSPSIAPAAGGGTVTAFQSPGNQVETFATGVGITNTGLTMLSTSSPTIAQITTLAR